MPVKKKEAVEEAQQTPTAGQVQQSVAQALQEYFTPEINEAIRELSDAEMHNQMRSLEQSQYWVPLLKYINQRFLVAQSVINQVDPTKDPGQIRLVQGHMQGLTDIQNYVIQLVMIEKNAQKNAEEITDFVL